MTFVSVINNQPIENDEEVMNHGGAREGPGRRRSGPDSVQVNWRVSEKAKAWIIEQARIQDVSVAAIIDELIEHATVATVRAEDVITPHPRPDYPSLI